MSRLLVVRSWLSTGPQVTDEGERIVIQTSRLTQVLTIGLLYKRVEVDVKQKVIRMSWRKAWFWSGQRKIQFKAVSSILYGYSDESWHSPLDTTHETLDRFQVGLRLHSGEDVHLFSFTGEGTFANNSAFADGWFTWRLFDYTGSQEEDSRHLINVLEEVLNCPVTRP